MNKKEVDKLAKVIWDYHQMNQKLEKADCILVLGSNDTRVAKRGAELFLEKFAPRIIFSGTGFGHKDDLLETSWEKPEAEVFAEVAKKMGVPEDKIIIEKESKNTGENIIFTKKLLEEIDFKPEKIILVQKPYMERRAYATFKKFWPDQEVIVTSPDIPFEKYFNEEIFRDDVINLMVGDLQRIKIYPKKGFQIPQEIPDEVWDAYEKLVEAGYTRHLIEEKA